MHMARRLPLDAAVRKPDSDGELLRLVASAANEAVDAVSMLAGPRVVSAIGQVAQRYARTLGISARDVADALQAARERLRKGTPMPGRSRGELHGENAPAAEADAPQPGSVEPTPAAG